MIGEIIAGLIGIAFISSAVSFLYMTAILVSSVTGWDPPELSRQGLASLIGGAVVLTGLLLVGNRLAHLLLPGML